MADVMCSTQSTVRIGGENIPLSQVQARFYRLDYSLMVYVFECLRRNTTQVRNTLWIVGTVLSMTHCSFPLHPGRSTNGS